MESETLELIIRRFNENFCNGVLAETKFAYFVTNFDYFLNRYVAEIIGKDKIIFPFKTVRFIYSNKGP